MALILETKHFLIEAPEQPKVHVSREDGGHVKITPKESVEDRTQLAVDVLVELAVLTAVVGEAMRTVLTAHGIPIGRINYQDNGNINQTLHVHLYGRAISSPTQPYGTVLQFPPDKEGFLESISRNEPLSELDIQEMKKKICDLIASDKYVGRITI